MDILKLIFKIQNPKWSITLKNNWQVLLSFWKFLKSTRKFSFSLDIKERKNRVRIRLFFSSAFIVLNRLDVFILRLVCLYWVATLIKNTINSIDRIVWIDHFDWNHDSNQREIFRIMTNELFWNLTKSRKVYKRNFITLKFIK